MAEAGGPNTLLWHRTSLTGTFDLNLAHPGGVAKLLSGRPTPLSDLVREQVAFQDAARRIGAISCVVVREDGSSDSFPVTVRIDQAAEVAIFAHGGILPMVLREALGAG